MRLIDVDALIAEHCNGCSKDIQDGCKTDPVCATLMWFQDAPTIDAVPVVRCKNCRWRNKDDDCTHEWWRDAEGWDKFVKDDDYCSYGERRGDTDG